MDRIEVVAEDMVEVLALNFAAILRSAAHIEVCLDATTGCIVRPGGRPLARIICVLHLLYYAVTFGHTPARAFEMSKGKPCVDVPEGEVVGMNVVSEFGLPAKEEEAQLAARNSAYSSNNNSRID